MGFTPIGPVVQREIDAAGLKGPVEASRVCAAFDELTVELFDQKLKDKAKALYLKNKALTVAATSSVVGQELKLHEPDILKALNEKVGSKVVERIRFLV